MGEDDPPPPPEDCGENLPLVTGSISTSVTDMDFDGVTATVNHKQDIDVSEDGCINRIELEFKHGSGCTLVVSASTVLQASALRVDSIALTADSQCPNFLDIDEGDYLGGLAEVEGSWIELSQTKIGEDNVPESCFVGILTVRPRGMISDGAKTLSFLDGELVVTGDFPTSALNMSCPVECMSDADCGADATCEAGSCEPIGGTTTDGDTGDTGSSTGTTTGTTTDTGDPASYGPCPGGTDAECDNGEICISGNDLGVLYSVCSPGTCTEDAECPDQCSVVPGSGELWQYCVLGGCSIDPCPGGMICLNGFDDPSHVCAWEN